MARRTAHLGTGVYTVSEVSKYTRLPSSTLRYWFKGSSGSGIKPVFYSDYDPIQSDYAVSFLDMIDALIAGELRESGVSIRTIRKAHGILSAELDTSHPFSHEDIYTDGKSILLYAAETLENEQLYNAINRQMIFPILKKRLRHIAYCDKTKLAESWSIHRGVVIDPTVAFGKPVVEHTGVSTFVLANQFYANEKDARLVANLYRVKQRDVRNAVAFEEKHGSKRAA